MIRPSGDSKRVEVRYLPSRFASFANYSGDWFWKVPQPKGHPNPPQWHKQFGHARTQRQAIEDALHRARYLYGPWDVLLTIKAQYRGSDIPQAYYVTTEINGEQVGRQLTIDHPDCGHEAKSQIDTYARGLARELVLQPLNHLIEPAIRSQFR